MDELPLLELFTRLRNAGLPLGISEYQWVLKALQGGFGLENRAQLKRLCQTLWIKSDDEKHLFDYHFDQVMAQPTQTLPLPVEQRRSLPRWVRYGILAIAFLIGAGMMLGLGEEAEDPVEELIVPTPAPSVAPAPVPQEPLPPPVVPPPDRVFDWVWWSLVSAIALGSGVALAWWVDRLLLKQTVRRPSRDSDSRQLSKATQEISDEIEAAQAAQQATGQERGDRFLLSSEYLPVTQRQMKRSWRYLYRPTRDGLATELDIDATVQRIGSQGVFLDPVLVPPRTNRAALLLLIDQDGSMVPFHALSQRLVSTALRGGRLGRTGVYYFHNCPVRHLYRDPVCQTAERIPEVLNRFPTRQLSVLIFSDGGAARGGLNRHRLQLTKTFLEDLQTQVRYVAWLNPMPRSRWPTTTAQEIARLVPMFEVDRQGWDAAIDVLRGRRSYAQLRV